MIYTIFREMTDGEMVDAKTEFNNKMVAFATAKRLAKLTTDNTRRWVVFEKDSSVVMTYTVRNT